MEPIHGKFYYSGYGSDYILQFDRVDGERVMVFARCRSNAKEGQGNIDCAFSACFPHCFTESPFREATEEEIKILEKSVNKSLRLLSLYEIY